MMMIIIIIIITIIMYINSNNKIRMDLFSVPKSNSSPVTKILKLLHI